MAALIGSDGIHINPRIEKQNCGKCNGAGFINYWGLPSKTCDNCNGTGFVNVLKEDGK